jgi:hypothetical protein
MSRMKVCVSLKKKYEALGVGFGFYLRFVTPKWGQKKVLYPKSSTKSVMMI